MLGWLKKTLSDKKRSWQQKNVDIIESEENFTKTIRIIRTNGT